MACALFSVYNPFTIHAGLFAQLKHELSTVESFAFGDDPIPNLEHPLVLGEGRVDSMTNLESIWLDCLAPFRDDWLKPALDRNLTAVVPRFGWDAFAAYAYGLPDAQYRSLADFHHSMVETQLRVFRIGKPVYFLISGTPEEEVQWLSQDERFSHIALQTLTAFVARMREIQADYFGEQYSQNTPIIIDGSQPTEAVVRDILGHLPNGLRAAA